MSRAHERLRVPTPTHRRERAGSVDLWFEDDGFEDGGLAEADDVFGPVASDLAWSAGEGVPVRAEPATELVGPRGREPGAQVAPRHGLPRLQRLALLSVAGVVAVVVFVAVLDAASGHLRAGMPGVGLTQADQDSGHVRTRTLEGSYFGSPRNAVK